MTLTYKLYRDVVGRTAACLNQELRKMNISIRIINKNRMINGNSLVGILQSHMRFGDVIKVIFEEEKQSERIRELFNEIGREI